eukprot:3426852-Rhodomonas_salina.3
MSSTALALCRLIYYAMSGTEPVYAATRRATPPPTRDSHSVWCYAMSGTEQAYGATARVAVKGLMKRAGQLTYYLHACYAMSDTDLAWS